MISSIAQDIADNQKQVISDDNKEILGDIRKTRVQLDDSQKSEIKYAYGSYNEYRKSLMGSVIFDNDGTMLDSQWQDWAEKYPYLFDKDENSLDMAGRLAEIVSSLRDTLQNEYGYFFIFYPKNPKTWLRYDQLVINVILALFY